MKSDVDHLRLVIKGRRGAHARGENAMAYALRNRLRIEIICRGLFSILLMLNCRRRDKISSKKRCEKVAHV